MVTAACVCTCSRPHLSLCSLCVLTHISTPGSHIIEPLPQSISVPIPRPNTGSVITSANEFCSVCMSGTAESVCCCETTGVVLCGKCIPQHTNKVLAKVHIILPLKARAFVGRPGYVDKLRERQNSLEKTIEEVKRNISRVENCQSSLRKRVDNYLQQITGYRDRKLEILSRYKALLQDSIGKVKSEVLEHIYEEDHVPCNPLIAAVWTCSSDQLNLFKFQNKGQYEVDLLIGLNPDLSIAPVNPNPVVMSAAKAAKVKPAPKQKPKPPKVKQSAPVTPTPRTPSQSGKATPRGICDPSSTLVHMAEGKIGLYNCFTRQFVPIADTPVLTSVMSSALLLPSGSIFISGKEKPISATALEVDVGTGKSTRLLDMLNKRFGHGVTHDGGSVYVFGGTGTEGLMEKCEAFGLQNRHWRRLADMTTARDFFNPCLYTSFVYIFGGRKTNLCEKYSIAANIFTSLRIRLPLDGHTTSVLAANCILILQKKSIARWRVEALELERVWTTGLEWSCWGNTNPLLINNTVFLVTSHQARVERLQIPAN